MRPLFLTAAMFCGLFITVDSMRAQTWTQTSATGFQWNSVASSADGSKLIAAGNAMYLSTNSGATWFSNNLPIPSYVSISADGSKLASLNQGGSILASTNYGTTWVTNYLGISQPFALAASADGSKLIALGVGPPYFVSTNYGITWSGGIYQSGSKAAISADGTKCYFVGYNSTNIYVSTNLGTSLNRIASPTNHILSLAVSADGKKLIAGTFPGPIYISTNSGISWMPTITPVTNWFFVASSADGGRLIGAARAGGGVNGPIYTSSDYGVTWVSNHIANLLWSGVACSADGGELLATYPNYIFMSKTTVSPQINITPTNGNLTVSWIIPSTNFVLQQKSDLTAANWVSLTNTPTLNLTNLHNEVVLTPTNSNGFFRLITQ